MALRDHVEGREAIGVAALSVVMWVGICWIFGLPAVMTWIVGALLFAGGVLKSSGSSAPDQADPPSTDTPTDTEKPHGKRSIYGPDE